jgi:hypothetical protein
MRYGGQNASQSCMSVRFNQRGTQILALRRRLPPVLYAVHSSMHICQFDHAGYYNSCTMKSCCFAGEDDQYVLSGSDDFNLYVWRIPPSEIKGLLLLIQFYWLCYCHVWKSLAIESFPFLNCSLHRAQNCLAVDC